MTKRVTTIAIDGKPLDANAITGPGMGTGTPTVRKLTIDELADKEFLSSLPDYLSIVIEGRFTGSKAQLYARSASANKSIHRFRLNIPGVKSPRRRKVLASRLEHHIFGFNAVVQDWRLEPHLDHSIFVLRLQMAGGVTYRRYRNTPKRQKNNSDAAE